MEDSPLYSSTPSSQQQHLLNHHREESETEQQHGSNTKQHKKLALLPLVFLIYFEVAGGPYGEEAAVGAAGPLIAILGFVIFPFIWSIPEALLTAELATTFPGNGGFNHNVLGTINSFGVCDDCCFQNCVCG
uniref:Uncharacterized protein n=1 Tax=Glycine max TaxID=3847 RepID=C6TFZ9_SOYBN|nr:unknown [Glycine max]